MKHLKLAVLFSLLASLSHVAHAALISVNAYSMPNGNEGSYSYFDDDYTGSGNASSAGAFLSGGVGKLTDGVIANDLWCNTESTGVCGTVGTDINGQYVGWLYTAPTITFSFDPNTRIDRITIYADDSEFNRLTGVTAGAYGFGGVAAPATVSVTELSQTFGLGNIANAGPNKYVLDFAAIETDTLTLQLTGLSAWIFVSEIQFEDTSIVREASAPTTLPLLMLAAGMFAYNRRKKAA
ncbi:PEP-CTERM sorting domain-containing protein [Alteromonas sp. CYL-A6]|uniref:PEP-CTERM sorting domain-containing protein n=1 Tax=Alteromonas nitratireducens TaxID=3390813 RepID=UPI0034A856A4